MTENIENNAFETESSPAPSQKKKSKALAVIAVILVLAVAAGLVFGLGSGKGSTEFEPIFYIENDVLYAKNINNAKQEVISIGDIDDDISFGTSIRITSDKSEIFFTVSEEESDDDSDIFSSLVYGQYSTLYRCKLSEAEASPVKIAEKVIDYAYDEATDTLYCISGEKGALTQIDSAGAKEIAENVRALTLSDDGQKIAYETFEAGAYYKENGKEAVALSENGLLVYTDKDFSFFYILEETNLYKVTADNARELIDSDVSSADFIDADGYYYKSTDTLLLKDLFEDDMAESDNEIKIPDDDSNEEAFELYTDRLTRDEIRSYILNPEETFSIQEVYYFNGTESKKMLENALNADTSYVVGAENESADALFCSVVDTESFEKIKMSKLWEMLKKTEDETDFFDTTLEVYDIISEPFVKYSTDYFIYKDKFAEPTNLNEMILDVIFDEKNNAIYLTAENEEKTTLYRFDITEEGLSKPELINESVSSYDVYLTEDSRLLYLEEIKLDDYEYSYNIYLDSELIAENVCYLSDYNYDTDTLEIELYQLLEDGSIDFEGDTVLMYYNLKTGEKIHFDAGYHLSYHTYSEKQVILREHDDMENYSVLILENGNLTDTGIVIPNPELVYPVSEYRYCYNYTMDFYDKSSR